MSFKLTILGSSGALPAYGRFPTAQHLSYLNHNLLIDCGEGTQLQLARYNISIHKISHIFISHLHGDHYLGLTGLLFSMHLQRRESDLHIYSFKGLTEILLAQLKHAKSVLHFNIIFHTLTEGEQETILDAETFSVDTIPLDHKIKTSGFLFREKPKPFNIDKSKLNPGISPEHIAILKKGLDVLDEHGNVLFKNCEFTLAPKQPLSYAYCSDTQPNETISAQIQGVDLLYHEATFMEEESAKARETKHSTASEAGRIAKLGKVKKLLIGHFSARYKDLEPLLNESRMIFPETYLASEGSEFEIS